ncbi:RNA methyltransferase [Ottowia sp.]|uniref:RNA methyltransferase n=1 Tax=Ottowia sp. TaxID=1898956 RepID=UPI003A86F52E
MDAMSNAAALPRTRFVLIEPSHAGNVGAVARALKVMGFDDLMLVRPRWADVLTRPEALERASGATDVLAAARCVPTLDDALHGMTHLCATAMTPRDFGPPTRAPRAHFDLLLNQELSALDALAIDGDLVQKSPSEHAVPEGVAFLFGSERYGMKNEDVYRCHVALSIPTDPVYGSLNLAAAVQLIAYDWRQALVQRFGDAGGFTVQPGHRPQNAPARHADAAQVSAMLAHLETALIAVDFLDPAAPKKLMPRLAQLFNRAQLTPEEIHILRGMAKAMQTAAQADWPARADPAARAKSAPQRQGR